MTLKLIKFGAVLFGLFCMQGAIYAADDARLVEYGEFRLVMQAHIEQIRFETAREIRDSVTQTREVLLDDQRRGIKSIHDHLTTLETHLKTNEEKIENVIIENQERRLESIRTEMRIMELMVRQEQRIRELTEALRDRVALPPPMTTDAESTTSEETNG